MIRVNDLVIVKKGGEMEAGRCTHRHEHDTTGGHLPSATDEGGWRQWTERAGGGGGDEGRR